MDGKLLLKKSVNFMTALGGSVSAVSLYFAFQNWEHLAWILMMSGVVVDALDGSLVRILGLKSQAPRYDGARLDEYADLITFVIAPVGFVWATGMLPFTWLGIGTGMIVIAVSCLQFSREDNKTESAFWGWPSFWNVAYFYAWAAELDPTWVIAGSLVLSAGVFVPVPFVYPSKLPKLRRTTMAFGGLWGVLLFAYLIDPDIDKTWLAVSLIFPVYYLVLSGLLHEQLK
ncbi:MAG: phosphatidylcholine/phosphatidylserine synthase [Bradymonadaceae bacterium]